MHSVSFVRSLELEEHSALPSFKRHGYGRSLLHGTEFFAANFRETSSLADDGSFVPSTFKSEGLVDARSFVSSTSKSEGLVDAGSLVAFTSEVPQQQKEDVLNSTLLAQLAAEKKYDRYTDVKNWYKFYAEVMGKIGWVMQSFKFDELKSSQKDFKISDVMVNLLSALVGGNKELINVVKETLDTLAKSANGVTLFSSKSASEKHGNFQIVPCTVDKDNQVNVAFIGCHFEASQVAKNYFFFSYATQDISLFHSGHSFTLNEGVYARVRDHVKEKLGDRAVDYVLNLDI